MFFSKNSHPKQISYTFLNFFFMIFPVFLDTFYSKLEKTKKSQPKKISYTQIVFISCILENYFLWSSSRRFLHRSRPYWRFFLFLIQKYFYTAQEHTDAICLFLLQNNLYIFHVLLFEAFLCVFDNIYLPFLYIEKKFYKIFFLIFFTIFSSEFSS